MSSAKRCQTIVSVKERGRVQNRKCKFRALEDCGFCRIHAPTPLSSILIRVEKGECVLESGCFLIEIWQEVAAGLNLKDTINLGRACRKLYLSFVSDEWLGSHNHVFLLSEPLSTKFAPSDYCYASYCIFDDFVCRRERKTSSTKWPFTVLAYAARVEMDTPSSQNIFFEVSSRQSLKSFKEVQDGAVEVTKDNCEAMVTSYSRNMEAARLKSLLLTGSGVLCVRAPNDCLLAFDKAVPMLEILLGELRRVRPNVELHYCGESLFITSGEMHKVVLKSKLS